MIVRIVEDDAAMRKLLATILESAGMNVCLYESAEQFLDDDDAQTSRGCLVLDLTLPGLGGVELLQQLRAQGDERTAVIITATADVSSAVRCMKLGAIELLQKPFDPSELLAVLRGAVRTAGQADRRSAGRDELRKRLEHLTPREQLLLQLIIDGRLNKQIAQDLNISIKTVANHRAKLMRKTGAINGPDLVRLSLTAGL
ncbi:MAG: two-component system, LuxR family, response regulator FixJ [Humisphaera sp.]|jgi:FixJ family two-component response regulator|nr:two-component system, LuxR family, response regulator FixJ [Humisphaera sp.]